MTPHKTKDAIFTASECGTLTGFRNWEEKQNTRKPTSFFCFSDLRVLFPDYTHRQHMQFRYQHY